MRRTLWVCVVLLLAVVVTSCARETDDETAAIIEGETRQDYVDALAWSASHEGAPFSRDEIRCIADGYVDAIGIEELRDKVTPDEIRDDPEADHQDWGIDLDREQGQALYETMQTCADLEAVYAEFAEAIGGDAPEDAGRCLAQSAEDEIVEDLIVGSIVDGDDYRPTEDRAGAIYDWMAGCMDLRSLLLDQIEDNVSPNEFACIESHLTYEIVKSVIVAGMTGEAPPDSVVEELSQCGPGSAPILI